MQTNKENQESENVVSIFAAKNNKTEESSTLAQSDADADASFESELKRNREIAEKLKRERQKANQAVLRSYRLKT